MTEELLHGSAQKARTAMAFALVLLGGLGVAQAQEPQPSALSRPGQAEGQSLVYGLGLYVPPDGGRLGLAGSGEIASDFVLGRVALAPGLRLAAYFGHKDSLALSMVNLRCLLPLPLTTLFLSTGVGPAYRSLSAKLSVAWQAAGGVHFAVSSRVALGLEASYVQLTSGAFRQISVGPLLRLSI
jgi:hypothetical protein